MNTKKLIIEVEERYGDILVSITDKVECRTIRYKYIKHPNILEKLLRISWEDKVIKVMVKYANYIKSVEKTETRREEARRLASKLNTNIGEE